MTGNSSVLRTPVLFGPRADFHMKEPVHEGWRPAPGPGRAPTQLTKILSSSLFSREAGFGVKEMVLGGQQVCRPGSLPTCLQDQGELMAKVFAFTLLCPGTPEAPPLGTALRLPLPSAFVCLFHRRCPPPPPTNRLSPRGKAWLLKPSVRRASRLSRGRRSPAPGMQLVPGVQTCQHPQRLCTGVTCTAQGPGKARWEPVLSLAAYVKQVLTSVRGE